METSRLTKRHAIAFGAAAAAGLLALTGCSSSGGGGGTSAAKNLTFIAGKTGDPFYITMKCGASAEAKKLGYSFNATGSANWSVPEQVTSVNSVAANHPGGVLISPVDPNSLAAPIKTLQSNGAKVAIVDTSLTDASIGVTHISSNNQQGGQKAADTMGELLGGQGEVVVLTPDLTTTTTNARIDGFKQELAAKYPGIKIDDVRQVGDSAQGAASAVSDELAAHPGLAGVFTANSQTGEGVGTGLKNAGKQGKVKVVSFDAGPQQVLALQNGAVDALISQDPYGIGQQAVDQLDASATGKPVTATIQTNLASITRDNLNDPDTARFLYKADCGS
ncbi:ABC transporter substrate-binding protein [Kitasatospora paracochleata]|uniref:ABC transporter substrate-binding protein n=1 Tax=Kitasatospora paracochleata TaxID=58354 RepID=UPI0031DCA9C5